MYTHNKARKKQYKMEQIAEFIKSLEVLAEYEINNAKYIKNENYDEKTCEWTGPVYKKEEWEMHQWKAEAYIELIETLEKI